MRFERQAKRASLKKKLRNMDGEISKEQLAARSAQAGILPYVQAAQAFNEWANEQPPELRDAIRAGLASVGLLDIKVGLVFEHEPNWFELLRDRQPVEMAS